ncbi:protein kinase [Nocardioides sp. 1609]|uniref:protein kinase domain-containing protein n=1 Tax=Nocardioides sp. 1609 TaxID=2508327 RepID=UPI0014318EC4|nr:protein kinase [Nocardioides sp. 1609]
MVDPDWLIPLKAGDPTSLRRCEILGRLGVGGMGVAFFARSVGKAAVVMMIQLDFADDPDAGRRVRREVPAASAVETPFVPEVLASDVSAVRQWVAMEYIEGATLEQLIRTCGSLDRHQQRALGAALAAGWTDLRRHGPIHRDLKPSNVISTSAGPRLIDFGVAFFGSLRT